MQAVTSSGQGLQQPTIIDNVVNTFSDAVLSSIEGMLFTMPIYASRIPTPLQNDWLGSAVVAAGIYGSTTITNKVTNILLSPFFSENANKSAQVLGIVIKVVSKLAVPMILYKNYAESAVNYLNIGTHDTISVLGLYGSAFLIAYYADQANKAAQANKSTCTSNKFPFESSYGPLSNYDDKEYVLTVLQHQTEETETDLNREDLIDALANPINGLLEHYGFLKFDLRKMDISSATDPENFWHSVHETFVHKTIEDGQIAYRKFVYYLKNQDKSALEDEIRDDLNQWDIPLPPRVYPESEATSDTEALASETTSTTTPVDSNDSAGISPATR